jgi:hypothetical protein
MHGATVRADQYISNDIVVMNICVNLYMRL